MVKKKVKFIWMVAIILFFTSSGIAFACYLKNKKRDGNNWCGNCSNKPDIILCCLEVTNSAWTCMAGKDGIGHGMSLEEAVAKTCGCD